MLKYHVFLAQISGTPDKFASLQYVSAHKTKDEAQAAAMSRLEATLKPHVVLELIGTANVASIWKAE